MKTAIDLYVIDAIRRERRAQKVSQAMLSFGIGVSRGFVGQVESPKYKQKIQHNPHQRDRQISGLFAAQVSPEELI
ncbi:MAG: XRE family transcriptional regulator [Alistipes putredinis]